MKREKKNSPRYDNTGLSAYCLQVSLLMDAGIHDADGIRIMAEDAATDWEKDLLNKMADDLENNVSLPEAMEKTGAFPSYCIRMSYVGHETGNLADIMKDMSVYYAREAKQAEELRDAVTYPTLLVLMLLVVLYILFSKVMPVFKDVYEQLGASLSPVTVTAMNIGTAASSIALVVVLVLLAVFLLVYFLSKLGIRPGFTDKLIHTVRKHSRISRAIAMRRFSSVLAMTFKAGKLLENGLSLAESVVENPDIQKKIRDCIESAALGEDCYSVLKKTGLFSRFHVQMIKVGSMSGHLDIVMNSISQDYDDQSEKALGAFISGFEPTIVAILAVCVGLVLLSVMLPLAGMLSSIG